MRIVLTLALIIGFMACQQESSNDTTTEESSNSVANTAPASIPTTEYPIVEVYQNKNGVPIYNGFLEADTSTMSSGNKYMVKVIAYDLWGKFLYLDKNYEVVATDKPDEITAADLGLYHPYLLRISVMTKPVSLQNVQTVQLGFSDNGVSSIHRTDFLNARLEGWDMQLSTKRNFTPCKQDDLKCNAEGVLQNIVGSMFR